MEKNLTEGPDLLDYYATDASRRGSLWTPEIECDGAETTVPRLLHMLLVLFEATREKGCPLMPHDKLAIVLKLIENNYQDQDQATAVESWKLVVMWCVMAAQADQHGDSSVAFAVEAVTENNDAYFGQWMDNRLDGTMGKRPVAHDGMGATGVATPAQGPAHFAAELSKGVAMGLRALGLFKSPSMTHGGGVDSDSKQEYREEDIAALMGFSHVKKGELQDIWTYFHTM